MIFRLSEHLFTSSQARSVDLLALLRGVALRGHSMLVVRDVYGFSWSESAVFEAWAINLNTELQSEVAWLRDHAHRISPNAVTRGATTVLVIAPNDEQLVSTRVVLNLDEAVRLATLPLFVLVENGLSDAAFVRRALPPQWRKKLGDWEKAGVVRFEHAGGIGEMKRIVEHCASEGTSADPLGLGAAAWRAAHFLLSDRDSQDETGRPSREASELQRACTRVNLGKQLHILQRRDQESYLPREAITTIVANKTGREERDDMLERLAIHFAAAKGRLHSPLPRVGESSWFKNAFLLHESNLEWDDAWFSRDGSGPEMIDLAEAIAAFL